eukprot:scaffold4026_cov39-Prasinocladus_malaysianus.AAC.2
MEIREPVEDDTDNENLRALRKQPGNGNRHKQDNMLGTETDVTVGADASLHDFSPISSPRPLCADENLRGPVATRLARSSRQQPLDKVWRPPISLADICGQHYLVRGSTASQRRLRARLWQWRRLCGWTSLPAVILCEVGPRLPLSSIQPAISSFSIQQLPQPNVFDRKVVVTCRFVGPARTLQWPQSLTWHRSGPSLILHLPSGGPWRLWRSF